MYLAMRKGMFIWQRRNTSETILSPNVSTVLSERELRTAERYSAKKGVLSAETLPAINFHILL